MNPNTHPETDRRPLTTADLAGAAPPESRERNDGTNEPGQTRRETTREDRGVPNEGLDALFPPDVAKAFRTDWADVQNSFVDDPRQAVRQGDELVAQVMQSLAESFSSERAKLEAQLQDGGDASTELLRVALRRYRSFFERLLAL